MIRFPIGLMLVALLVPASGFTQTVKAAAGAVSGVKGRDAGVTVFRGVPGLAAWPAATDAPSRTMQIGGVTSAVPVASARGLYNWIHSTGDAEKAFAFYHDVFGIELTRSPFGGPAGANAAPETIRPAASAGSDPLVWDLTNTHGSRFRNVFMRAPNTAFGLELSEFFDVSRSDRVGNPWDPGASRLIFVVRDLDAMAARMAARRTPVVTLGGAPVATPNGRALLVRDPDGYLIEVRQGSTAVVAAATSPGDIVETRVGLTVARMDRARAYYEGLLGFVARTTAGPADAARLRLNGLAGGSLTEVVTAIPGTSITVELSEFTLPAGVVASPLQWRLQDVGSPQFQLQVVDLDALIERTKAAGYRFVSVGAKPIQRPFGRFVFAADPDSVLVEYVEPTQRR